MGQEFTKEQKVELSVFYNRMAVQMAQSMKNTIDLEKNPNYLQHQLESFRKILCMLEKPWERYVPMLHQSFILYYDQLENDKEREKAMGQSMQMMTFVSEIVPMRKFIDKMIKLVNKQIEEINNLKQ